MPDFFHILLTFAVNFLSHYFLDTFIHPLYLVCILFTYSHTAECTTALFSLTALTASLSFTQIHFVLLQLTFMPLLSRAYLHFSKFSFTCSLLSLWSTTDHNVYLSITSANKKWHSADPHCSLTSALKLCHNYRTSNHCPVVVR